MSWYPGPQPSCPLPPSAPHLQLHLTGKVATCSDSEHVVLVCVQGAAKRWKMRGWPGSCGPVSNAPIWEMILNELERPNAGRPVWCLAAMHGIRGAFLICPVGPMADQRLFV